MSSDTPARPTAAAAAAASASASASASIEVRPADERGSPRLGWLNSRHSFSFGGYHDPRKMGYHGLRVLNDDRVAPGGGFDTHPHRDMEILTWVLDGRLAHRDSMGHASALGPGGLQVMSAGSGVTHSEFNASDAAPVHFLQVWIQPTQTGTEPRYAERSVDPAARDGKLALLAADDPSGDAEAIEIGADARVYVGDFRSGQSAVLQVNPDRVAYVHVATGQLTVNDTPLEAGDAVTLEGVDQVRIEGSVADAAGQLLLFDLPA